jgi:ABC-type dipeptide/oligopeptide/nickel transport system ATPase component
MTQTLALEMIRITKTFGAVQALVDADLKVAKGTVHGLVGQNGTGKSGEGARPRQGPRRLRLRHGRLQHRPPAQAYGPDGRASRNMKSEKTRTQLQAKTSKMSPIHPQKIAPASLIAQTH